MDLRQTAQLLQISLMAQHLLLWSRGLWSFSVKKLCMEQLHLQPQILQDSQNEPSQNAQLLQTKSRGALRKRQWIAYWNRQLSHPPLTNVNPPALPKQLKARLLLMQ
jgi:hypothetical protein